MVDYIKNLVKKPTEIYTARNMKNKHYFLFILFMGFTLTFFSVFELKEDLNNLKGDYQEIQNSIPDFKVVDSQLESDVESYVYQTDNLVFYFDSEDTIDNQLIDKNMQKQFAPMSLGLKKDAIYLNIIGQSQSFKYSDLGMTTEELKSFISLNKFSSPLFYVLFFIILLVFNLILYLMQLFSISIFANVISFVRKTRLTFFQNAKIALLASMIPFLVIQLLTAFNLTIAYQYELVMVASLILFYLTIDEFKKRLEEQNKA